jgi:hypothetical protein
MFLRNVGLTFNGLHGVIYQKTELFFMAVPFFSLYFWYWRPQHDFLLVLLLAYSSIFKMEAICCSETSGCL